MKKEIITASQEKKLYSSRQTETQMNTFTALAFGLTKPVLGAQQWNRIGDTVRLTGVRIHVQWTQTNTVTGDQAANCYCHLFVVMTNRDQTFKERWFVDGENRFVDFDVADEKQRAEYRVNRKDKKILLHKKVKLQHYKPGTTARYHYDNTWYVPLNYNVRMDVGETTDITQIHPRIAVAAYAIAPDANTSLDLPTISMRNYVTWFYRE